MSLPRSCKLAEWRQRQAACRELQDEVARLQRDLARERENAMSAEEKTKARRLEALAHKVARRLANAGILAGWGAWHEQWEEKARQRRMLAAAGARLARPALVKCFGMWHKDWADEVHAGDASYQVRRPPRPPFPPG